VGLWRKRFAARGIAGLHDQPRPGKTPKYGEALRLRILRQLELPPPPGLAGWDGGTLSAALGVSDAAVWRVLRKEGIQLRRHRSWCVSTDPQFAAKAADIIGLYLDPPENALVLSVDEKPSIQALERATGYVLTSSGKIVQGLRIRARGRKVVSEVVAGADLTTDDRPDAVRTIPRPVIRGQRGNYTVQSHMTETPNGRLQRFPAVRCHRDE
jgi:hypothetical protein